MTPENARYFDGRKFMWDWELYDTEEAAEARREDYRSQDFETQVVEEGDRYLVYTRRVVKEVVVEGEPPI